MPRPRSVLAAFVSSLALLGLVACSGTSQGRPTKTQTVTVGPSASTAGSAVAAVPADVKTPSVPTVVILDASGSMATVDDGKRSRMEIAHTALQSLATSSAPDMTMSLVTYGAKTTADTPQKTSCADITVAVAQSTPAKVAAAGQAIKPGGWTPIGASLTKAATLLPATGPSSILLVTDGSDTCKTPPPCTAAAQIKQQHPEVTISLLAVKTNTSALTCLASLTGGITVTADNAAQFVRRLSALADIAAAKARLSPTSGLSGVTIGMPLADIRAQATDFPASGSPAGAGWPSDVRVVIVWKDCEFGFDQSETLVAIRPKGGVVTLDGVKPGSPLALLDDLFGPPVATAGQVRTYTADAPNGLAWQATSTDGQTVQTIVLCRCLNAATNAWRTIVLGSNGEVRDGNGAIMPMDNEARARAWLTARVGSIPGQSAPYMYGRLSIGFYPAYDGWSYGDPVADEIPGPPLATTEGLKTDTGLHYGSTFAEVAQIYPDIVRAEWRAGGDAIYASIPDSRLEVVFRGAPPILTGPPRTGPESPDPTCKPPTGTDRLVRFYAFAGR